MASGLGSLTVWLNADTRQFRRGIWSAQQTLRTFAKLAGLGAAGYALKAFASSSVDAFAAQEQATNRLAAALGKLPGATSATLPSLQKLSAEMQRQTVYGDEQIQEVVAYGANLGITADRLDEAATAAAGLAAKYGIDLRGAMMLLGRASQGQTAMLARYGIVLDETLSPQEKFSELLKIGAGSFRLAQAETETYSGKLAQLKNAYGDVKEGIGQVIVETLALPGVFGSAADSLANLAQDISHNAQAVALFVRTIAIDTEAAFSKIFAVGQMAFANIPIAFSWVWGNWSKLLGNVFSLFAAYLQEFTDLYNRAIEGYFGVFKAFWSGVWGVMKGGDVSSAFRGVMEAAVKASADLIGGIGGRVEAALDAAGVSKLDLFGFDDMAERFRQIDEEAAKRREKLFADTMDRVGAKPPAPGSPAAAAAAAAKATPARSLLESSVVGAIQRGSVEALKAENTRVRKDTEIAQNTKRTADGIDRLCKALPKSAAVAGVQLEDAFA